MTKPNEQFNLPVGPAQLCFDKNHFMKKNFSVDEFLQEHRNVATLETMRDDLGIYLKVLRSAMIELINEDYADFVNLSSNLVGLDQQIETIRTPVLQLKEEILRVQELLTDTMSELKRCLEEKHALEGHLKSIECLGKVHKTVTKLEKLLTDEKSETITRLERVAMEMVHLEFNTQFCLNLISETDNDRITKLNQNLMEKLSRKFLDAIGDNSKNIEHTLRIYCTLDRCKTAEQIYQKQIIGPYMHPIISEPSLQNHPNGLAGILEQVHEFAAVRMKEILRVASQIEGYNFLLNSYWMEVEQRLELHMSSIFAPGNPDQFYQRYRETMSFLDRLAELFDEEGRVEFLTNEQYKKFQSRWNLPVYFQIRFQEIGGAMETSCSRPITDKIIIKPTNDKIPVRLQPFAIAIVCIEKCWSDGIYLPQLFVKFLKLSFQIIARTVRWVDDCLTIKELSIDAKSPELQSKVAFFMLLYINLEHILTELLDLKPMIIQKMPKNLLEQQKVVETCFNESSDQLERQKKNVEGKLSTELLRISLAGLKQVNDIPRLFRKTNRDVPTRPCPYVDQMVDPIRQFYHENDKRLTDSHRFFVDIFSTINSKYFSAVNDVLTSVHKTEESLRRLKNLREKSSGSNATQTSGMSDDDKIRLQLQIDVSHWTESIEKLQINRSEVDRLLELNDLIDQNVKREKQ